MKSLAELDRSKSTSLGSEDRAPATGKLNDRFVVPPFTVLDTRQGYWQDRKRAWLGLGIRSELGRGEDPDDENSRKASRPSAQFHGKTGDTRDGRLSNEEYKGGDAWLSGAKKSKSNGRNLAASFATSSASPSTLGERYGKKPKETDGEDKATGTSIFDPVLCELMYRWFAPRKGTILDPFAGGSVRGITAAALGYKYVGIELRPEQVAANREQKDKIVPGSKLVWINGDARDTCDLTMNKSFDFVFTCPPYYNLELYSYNPADLSNAEDYQDFVAAYNAIIGQVSIALKPDRFACYVVGNIRDKDGLYHDLVGDTIKCFESYGMRLYNEAILVTAIGSLPIRINNQFDSYRKMGKTHQNILVFVKGDPRKAAKAVLGA